MAANALPIRLIAYRMQFIQTRPIKPKRGLQAIEGWLSIKTLTARPKSISLSDING